MEESSIAKAARLANLGLIRQAQLELAACADEVSEDTEFEYVWSSSVASEVDEEAEQVEESDEAIIL